MTESRSFEDVYKAQTERIAQLEHELAALRERLTQKEQEHEAWCASLTQLLLINPPKPAPCNCKTKITEPEQKPVAWIKCSERLPQNKRAVLVLSPSNRCIFCAYWDTDQWLYFGGYPQPISHPVTHWRTIPPPPTGDEK